MLKNYSIQADKKFESWLGRFNPLYAFLAIIFAKLFDSFTAAAGYFLDPARFALMERNEITRKAFLYGDMLPYLVQYVSIIFMFALVTYFLFKLKTQRGKFTPLVLALIGILPMWIFPIGAATNITLGIFMLQLAPLSLGIVYVLIAAPIAWVLTRYGWGVKDLRVLAFMLATIVFMSFIMFARVI